MKFIMIQDQQRKLDEDHRREEDRRDEINRRIEDNKSHDKLMEMIMMMMMKKCFIDHNHK